MGEANGRKQDEASGVEVGGEPGNIDSLSPGHGSGYKRSNGVKIMLPTNESICEKEPTTRLSTEEIMRVAGKRFIQSYSQTVDIMPIYSNLFDLSLSKFSSGEMEDIELAGILLASAEKVSNQEYERASKLLSQCDLDLEIKSGVQWALLLQALASRKECPLESLKITAVDPCSRQMEGAGKWLTSFAETMNFPFSFKMVTMSDVSDLKEDQFEIDTNETVAVYSEFFMSTMIPQPDRMDSLVKVIRKFNPCIMVIIETDSNLNSPDYVSRFIEALFFYSAYFDCVDVCMEKDDESRLYIESLLSQGIKSVVVAEGQERKIRHVKIDVWRAFLSRFGMEEKDLSTSSLFQAHLMVKHFGCADSCTLDMNGKSLIIGWRGTPIHSLSVWKFL